MCFELFVCIPESFQPLATFFTSIKILGFVDNMDIMKPIEIWLIKTHDKLEGFTPAHNLYIIATYLKTKNEIYIYICLKYARAI